MTLPFPPGEAWYVIQGYDDAAGSHKGYASFCWDFSVAGHPQGGIYPNGSNGAPFYAAAPGRVVTVVESGVSGTSNSSNLVEVEQASGEISGYLHLQQNIVRGRLCGIENAEHAEIQALIIVSASEAEIGTADFHGCGGSTRIIRKNP